MMKDIERFLVELLTPHVLYRDHKNNEGCFTIIFPNNRTVDATFKKDENGEAVFGITKYATGHAVVVKNFHFNGYDDHRLVFVGSIEQCELLNVRMDQAVKSYRER